jgi:DNA polymerase III subunit delta
MTPQQFLSQLKQGNLAPVYLFLGPEPYQRDFCRKALIERALPSAEDRENGLTRYDLKEASLPEIIDDARSPSLFAADRLILVSNAEEALPRVKGAAAEDAEGQGKGAGVAALANYVKDPTPGVVLVFQASKYDLQGEDKKKLETVRKFYYAIEAQVEFAPFTEAKALQLAERLAQKAGLELGAAELQALVDALGADAARIASEIEKLRLYAGSRRLTAKDISELIPEAREATIFALVDALGHHDRVRSLELLDALVRQSEYLPLALSFLSTQFRMALAAKEAGLRTPQQVLAHFSKAGVAMWPSRAEQICRTVTAFTGGRFAGAVKEIFAVDRALRDTRPDDRVVMEDFILRLTSER